MLRAFTVLILAVAAVSAKNLDQYAKGQSKLEMIGSYYFSEEQLPWYESRTFCEENNLTLVSIETADKAKEIQTLAPRQDYYWTSGTDDGHDHGYFFWANKQSISHQFELWALDEPSDYLTIRAEACVTFDTEVGLIFDEAYWGWNYFICE